MEYWFMPVLVLVALAPRPRTRDALKRESRSHDTIRVSVNEPLEFYTSGFT